MCLNADSLRHHRESDTSTFTFRVIADTFGWRHIVLISNDEAYRICWYGAKPFDEVFGSSETISSQHTYSNAVVRIAVRKRVLWFQRQVHLLELQPHWNTCAEN